MLLGDELSEDAKGYIRRQTRLPQNTRKRESNKKSLFRSQSVEWGDQSPRGRTEMQLWWDP